MYKFQHNFKIGDKVRDIYHKETGVIAELRVKDNAPIVRWDYGNRLFSPPEHLEKIDS